MSQAFEVTEDDVFVVLHNNLARIANPAGISLGKLAEKAFYNLDASRVERVALECAGDIEEQSEAAHQEIESILVEDGLLNPAGV